MKKILLLGGSESKSIAISKAKDLGYYTILCDYLPDNYGRNIAHKFYQESTTDNDAVLKVARTENVDGIVSYASDYGAPAAAYAAENLGLPTNPFESVLTLREKHRFREFLKNNGFPCPKAISFDFSSYNKDIENLLSDFSYPLMVKPTDSCGSNGISRIDSPSQLEQAYETAYKAGLQKRVIIEEYIENDYPYVIGGDIFVQNGQIVCWGLLNCHRDHSVNSLVPTGKSYPLLISDCDYELIKSELQRLLQTLNITMGAFNIEIIIHNHKVYFIEVGPRNGGNEIPDFLSVLTGSDIISATIEAALGNTKFKVNHPPENVCMSTYNIHSSKDGKYVDTVFAEEYLHRIIRTDFFVKPGTDIKKFDKAGNLIGIVFLKHDSVDEMTDMMNHPEKWQNVIVE